MIYDAVGFIYKKEPSYDDEGNELSPGELICGDDGEPLWHVNSLPGEYPQEAEQYRIDPYPNHPHRLFAGVEKEDTIFMAFPSQEVAERLFFPNDDFSVE